MSKTTEYKNILIAGVWQNNNGHLSTMVYDQKTVDALLHSKAVYDDLREVLETDDKRFLDKVYNVFSSKLIGGKALIRKRSAEVMAKSKNPETTPQYFLEFVPKEEVDAFNARNVKKGL